MDGDGEYQRVLLSQALPGMVLAQAVRSRKGDVLLCGPGTELDDELITRLMLRGVKRIDVEGTPLPAPPRGSHGDALADVKKRFSRAEPTDLMIKIQQMVTTIIEVDP